MNPDFMFRNFLACYRDYTTLHDSTPLDSTPFHSAFYPMPFLLVTYKKKFWFFLKVFAGILLETFWYSYKITMKMKTYRNDSSKPVYVCTISISQ